MLFYRIFIASSGVPAGNLISESYSTGLTGILPLEFGGYHFATDKACITI